MGTLSEDYSKSTNPKGGFESPLVVIELTAQAREQEGSPVF